MRHLPLIRITFLTVLALLVQSIWARSVAAGGACDFYSSFHQFNGQVQVFRFNADIGRSSSDFYEEAEQKARKENDAALLYAQMLRTATAYVEEHQFDKAERKWTDALAEVQSKVLQDRDPEIQQRVQSWWRGPERFHYTRYFGGALQRSQIAAMLLPIGREFEFEGQLKAAEKVYTTAYEFSLESRQVGREVRIEVDGLANTIRTSGDTTGGIRLLEKFLFLCREHQSNASPEVGLWQLKLANYYAMIGDVKHTKRFCHDFLQTLNKSDLNVADQSITDSMVEHAYILRAQGFRLESDRISRKVAAVQKRRVCSSV